MSAELYHLRDVILGSIEAEIEAGEWTFDHHEIIASIELALQERCRNWLDAYIYLDDQAFEDRITDDQRGKIDIPDTSAGISDREKDHLDVLRDVIIGNVNIAQNENGFTDAMVIAALKACGHEVTRDWLNENVYVEESAEESESSERKL